jgi:thiol-disulfide isomerase/thioredoxin
MSESIRKLVEKHLSEDSRCYNHCDTVSRHYFIGDDTACYACGGGYVSRIIMYGSQVDASKLRNFVDGLFSGSADIRDEDIRVATRHPWELGVDETGSGNTVLREAYWNQNYRRGMSKEPDRIALYRCISCGRLFTQPYSQEPAKCDSCRGGGRASDGVKRVIIVYANWCPHCVPTTVGPMTEMAKELNAELTLLDIDVNEKEADSVVREYGDWAPDYIIPQVFFEYRNGNVSHILSGFSEGVDFTRRAVEQLRKSRLFSELRGK